MRKDHKKLHNLWLLYMDFEALYAYSHSHLCHGNGIVLSLCHCFTNKLHPYRKVHTQSAKKWLERLQKEKVPTLVCLTFGDKLYAEHMTNTGEHPRVADMSKVIKSQITVNRFNFESE